MGSRRQRRKIRKNKKVTQESEITFSQHTPINTTHPKDSNTFDFQIHQETYDVILQHLKGNKDIIFMVLEYLAIADLIERQRILDMLCMQQYSYMPSGTTNVLSFW